MSRLFARSLVSPSRGSILDHEELVPISQLIETPLPKQVPKDSGQVERAKASEAAPVRSPRAATPAERVVTEGKFFRVGSQKFHPRGVTYGPFKANDSSDTFPTPEQVERDFELMKQLNANCLRVYHVPPRWFLDLAQQHGLKVLVDYYWPKHTFR